MLELKVNNGNTLAQDMHTLGILKDGLSCDDYFKVISEVTTDPKHIKWLLNDDFWEDFCYTVEELGYKLKV